MRLIDAELFRDELFRHYELVKVDDYEVWAVVDVDEVLDNIEEVEAIPIDWLQKKMTEYVIRGKYSSDRLPIAYSLISDWRKENE